MKTRLFLLLLTAALVFSLTGCLANDGVPNKVGLTIVTTNYFLYDAARTIAGEDNTVVMLLSPGTESHDFELTLTDMALLETCDLFAYVGGESEAWVYTALETFAENGITIPAFCAMEAVEQAGILHHSGEHSHDHDHAAHAESHYAGIDDHVWLSIPNAIAVIEGMMDSIQGYYEAFRFSDGIGTTLHQLIELDEKFRSLTASVGDPVMVVADRFPFLYLAEEYGIGWYGAFDGCASDTEPSLETVNTLLEITRAGGYDTIFVTELSDKKTAEAIAAQTDGLAIAELHSAHNVTQADYDAGVTYLELMERNYTALEKLWKKN